MGLEGLRFSFSVEKSQGKLVNHMFLLRLQMFLLRLQQPAGVPVQNGAEQTQHWVGDDSDLQHYCANSLYSSAPAVSGRPKPTLPC